ncbi:uncharacterized protein LOC143292035 isoform X1 [Babylonia areolata]|uniref:uncharacterized protein LOC143292035 isoform X1 n=1 Tax=Babylonia areolata TaxID=304850 RepID=UPI003FD3AD41
MAVENKVWVYLLAVLCLTIVLCTARTASPSESFEDLVDVEESVDRSKRQASCKLSDGLVYEDGENFTRYETGPCVFYLCRDGNVLPLEYGCYRNHKCYPLNDVFKLGCIERTCQLYNGHFEYVLSKEGCMGRDLRTCVAVGATYSEGCFKYRCDKRELSHVSLSYNLEQYEYGCELNGQCVPENYTYVQGCRTTQCQKRFMNVGFYIVSDGCEINGQCVDVGHTLVDSCRTFNCTVKDFNGLKLLNIDPIKIQCKDTDGVCHDSGAYFPIEVNHQRVNCTCQVEGYNIQYSCPGIGAGA